MSKTTERLSAWLENRRARAAERRKAASERRMSIEASRTVQAREFGGELYISVGGVPVLPVEGLKWDVVTALDVSRDAYVAYLREREDERKAKGYGR